MGAALTMTYDDTILDTNTSTALGDVKDNLGDIQEEVVDDVKEFCFEEETYTYEQEPQLESERPMELEMKKIYFIKDVQVDMIKETEK